MVENKLHEYAPKIMIRLNTDSKEIRCYFDIIYRPNVKCITEKGSEKSHDSFKKVMEIDWHSIISVNNFIKHVSFLENHVGMKFFKLVIFFKDLLNTYNDYFIFKEENWLCFKGYFKITLNYFRLFLQEKVNLVSTILK